jgi:epidermal growth factor receptor substrate 15
MNKFLVLICFVCVSFLNLAQLDDAKKAEFNKFIRSADLLFSQNKFLDAKKVYESALEINPTDVYATKQRDKCVSNEQNISADAEHKSYQKIILKADEKFDAVDYAGAKSLYERALSFKPNDPYPKKKLAEIEDLLNPKPAAKSEPLPDLGVTSDVSVIDAEKILKDADAQRKNKQNTLIDEKNKKLKVNEEDMTANRLKEMQASNNVIEEVERKIETQVLENKDQKDSLNTNLQQKQKSTQDLNENIQTLQHEKNLSANGELYKKSMYRDSATVESKELGVNNPQLLYHEDKKTSDSLYFVDQKMSFNRNHAKNDLALFSDAQEKKVVDNTESQKLLAEKVTETNLSIEKVENELTENKVKNTNNLRENVSEMSKEMSEKELEGAKNGGNNMNVLAGTKNDVVQSSDSLHINPKDKILSNKNELFKVDGKSIDSLALHAIDMKDNRMVQIQAMESVIKTEEFNIELERQESKDKLQEDLKKKKADHTNLENINKEKQDSTAQRLKNLGQHSYELESASQAKEIDEKFSSKDKINTLETKVIMGNSENNGISSENASSIGNLNNALSGNHNVDAQRQTEKNLEARAYLESLEKKTVVFDDQAANSIGALYPEGVTQEAFNKTDEDGLVTAVVTRRIVVKNGFGQIYTRTQTLNNITYSKNGAPSTEIVWQRETQDAKLKKN